MFSHYLEDYLCHEIEYFKSRDKREPCKKSHSASYSGQHVHKFGFLVLHTLSFVSSFFFNTFDIFSNIEESKKILTNFRLLLNSKSITIQFAFL